MKFYRIVWLILFILCIYWACPWSVHATSIKDDNRQVLNDLLNELDQKIKDADKRMIAHPTFLKELQALVNKYRGKIRKVFLREDFSDGNYTSNPKWQAVSGQFEITSSWRLRSKISVERPSKKPSSKGKSDLFGAILKEVIKSTEDKKEQKASTPVIKEATIRTFSRISPAFEVDIVMISHAQWGSMEIVLLGGKRAVPRYRLVYHAVPSADRPIQIIRERDSRSYIIEAATRYPTLDDGSPHRIQWIRDSNGKMSVLVDEKEVLSTVEVFYKKDFSGISLINQGGIYEWGPIEILEAPSP